MSRSLPILLPVLGFAVLVAGCAPGGGSKAPTAIVGGKVVSADTDTPLAQVRVFALPAGQGGTSIPIGTPEVTTGADGVFRIDDAPVGSVDLFIRPGDSSGLQASTVRLTTRANLETNTTCLLYTSPSPRDS